MTHRLRKRLKFVSVVAAFALVAGVTWQTLGAAAEQAGTSKVPGNAWPPKRAGSANAAPLTPEQALDSFSLPPGYRVEIVAAEPMVDSPILLDWDADGRMWVVEMPGFLPDESGQDSKEPIDRIVVLEDTDDDGKMDKRTIFADKLDMPRSIKVLDQGVLIGIPPNLWYMRDTDGDLKADTREIVVKTYGRGGNVEHDANSLLWAMDNIMYSSEHTWDLKWTGNGKFDSLPTISKGQWLITQDDFGRVFKNTNDSPLFVDFTPARYFLRNPNNPRTRGLYESLLEQMDATVYPVRDNRGVNRGYRDELFRADGSSIVIQGTSGPEIYRGDRYPASMRGDAFIADSTTNLVHQMEIVDDGSGRLTAKNTWPQGEFFASSDERSRPVASYSAPDGTMYVVDMYRGVVQAAGIWSDYLTGYIGKKKLLLPVGMGRIYRVVYDGPNNRGPKPQLSKATPAQLVATLSHANGWWRDRAQQLMIQRGDKSVTPALQALVANAPDARTRLHALWTIEGLGEITPELTTKALMDKSADVRAGAIKIAERWLRTPDHAITASVLKLGPDASWTVRRQFAASLGELPGDARIGPAVGVLQRDGNDPIIIDALVSGLKGVESKVLQQVIQSTSAQGPVDGITVLSAALAKSGDIALVQLALDAATDAKHPAWQRRAILAGLSAALPTPPALGRGGQVRTPGLAPPGRDRAQITPGKGLTLAAEPVALTKLAGGTGPEAAAAADLAARLNWTGKPVPATPPLAALTADEQKHFEAGKAVYLTRCAGCHGAEGQGKEKVVALANSKWVNAPSVFPIRILANGKEGPMGMMPPVVKQLNDDEIADVLTYVRRAWGNTGSPIAAVEVRETRQGNVKTGVWTEEELNKLLQAAAGRGGRGGQ